MVSNVGYGSAMPHVMLEWCIKCQTDAQGWPLNSVRRGMCRWTRHWCLVHLHIPHTPQLCYQKYLYVDNYLKLLSEHKAFFQPPWAITEFTVPALSVDLDILNLLSSCPQTVLHYLILCYATQNSHRMWYDMIGKTKQFNNNNAQWDMLLRRARQMMIYEGSNSTKTTRTSIRPLLKLTVQDVITQILPTWWKNWSISNLSDPQTNVKTRKIAVLWYTEARKG